MKKEIRALVPLWAASVAVVAIAGLAFPDWPASTRMFYGIASIALAALSVGHEYVHGTLTTLLALPVTRPRLLAMKLSAVVPMLLTLAGLALLVVPPDPRFDRNTALPRLALFSAILLAPLLTMLTRSPLAGVVFAGGIAACMSRPGSQYFGETVARWGLFGACAVAVVGGWQAFMRLEAVDHRGNSLALPLWSRTAASSSSRAPRPVWRLIQKEFRLQQMAFVVAAIHVVMGAAASIPWSSVDEVRGVIGAISVIYGVLLAVLIGSLAGAEERQMQTLGWQLLLPIAAWKQWAVKLAVTLVVALLLCLGIPAILSSGEVILNLGPLAIVFFVLVGSLYISTLCDSVLTAMAVSASVMLVLVMALVSLIAPGVFSGASEGPLVLAAAVMYVLALRFAYQNHIRMGRDQRRVAWQLVWMAAIIVVAGAAYFPARVRY